MEIYGQNFETFEEKRKNWVVEIMIEDNLAIITTLNLVAHYSSCIDGTRKYHFSPVVWACVSSPWIVSFPK